MGAPQFPKAGEWRASTMHRFAVVSERRVARSAAVTTDPDYWGGHFVAEVAAPWLVPLVAAAPDMAEALDGVLQAHSNLAIHMAVAEHSRDPANLVRQSRLLDALDTACETARAALSKAKGETE